jgi:Flp pilus assembly protein TadG
MSVYRSLTHQLRRWQSDERGNFVITAAILLPVMVGGVGAAVTYSNANASRTSLQSSLDAAVLAGTIALSTGGNAVTVAQNVFNNDVNSHATQTTSNIAAAFSVNGDTVSGKASGNAVNPFAGLIGSSTIPLTVNAAATQLGMPVCVLALDSLDDGSFDINGQPTFNANNCAVQANSAASKGMTQEGNAQQITAGKFGVTGGSSVSNFSPPPVGGSPAIADPYASLPFPPHTACTGNEKDLEITTTTTLSPGTYCSGIHIYATANVTLQPGIYVMNGGPFWTDGSAVVTGDQVMIAFTGKGATLQIWGNSSVSVTSPTSGTYTNMQFLQDNSDQDTHSLWASIGGSGGDGAKLSYDGVAYFPTQYFWVRGSTTVNANSPSVAIVSSEVSVQGSATVNITHNNTRNLNVQTPTTSYGARLIN